MSIAFKAMQFAREVHKDQVRKYTGDVRTTPPELVEAMVALYTVGVRVSLISKATGIPVATIRNYVANHSIKRDESLFEFGVHCIAAEGEKFRRVPWAPWYFVSNLGRVVGISPAQPGTLLKQHVQKSGYWCVKLSESDGVTRNNYLHRLVLTVFDREPKEGEEAAHGDGRRHNNRLDNLRWATPEENAADKIAHGTLLIGSSHPNAKIDESVALQIKNLLSSGERQVEISRSLNVSLACVTNIAQGKTWKHVRSEHEHSV